MSLKNVSKRYRFQKLAKEFMFSLMNETVVLSMSAGSTLQFLFKIAKPIRLLGSIGRECIKMQKNTLLTDD